MSRRIPNVGMPKTISRYINENCVIVENLCNKNVCSCDKV